MDTQWLRTQLEERHLRQADVARALGRDPSAISRLMKGERALSLVEAKKLASLLEVDVETVMSQEQSSEGSALERLGNQLFSGPLSSDEREVLALIGDRLGNGTAAARLDVASSRVKRDLARILDNLKANRDAEPSVLSPDIPLYGRSDYRASYIVRHTGPVRVVPRPAELRGVDAAYAADVISDEMAPRYFPGERIYVAPTLARMQNAFVLVWHKTVRGEVGRILRLIEFDDQNANFCTLYPHKEDVVLPHAEITAMHDIIGCFV